MMVTVRLLKAHNTVYYLLKETKDVLEYSFLSKKVLKLPVDMADVFQPSFNYI